MKAISDSLRTRALSFLQKKKIIVKLIEKREVSLMTLEGIYDKVSEAHTEAEVNTPEKKTCEVFFLLISCR
jgi:hypothetical protein